MRNILDFVRALIGQKQVRYATNPIGTASCELSPIGECLDELKTKQFIEPVTLIRNLAAETFPNLEISKSTVRSRCDKTTTAGPTISIYTG